MTKGGKECFVIDGDVLYALADGVKRLVVPGSCRPMIMNLAHTLPWAGHLGRNKTYLRIASRFYWPSMYTDVQTFCRTCPTCQKTCFVRQSDRAYLQPLPIISTPFRRIAMDIVGPLVRSSRGHQYILVVCDYATRFPEAFPLSMVCPCSAAVSCPAVLQGWCSGRDHHRPGDKLYLQTSAALSSAVGHYSRQNHLLPPAD